MTSLVAADQRIYITIADANDQDPVFNPTQYNVRMPEGLPIGAVVTDVTATDDDIGENARLVFTLDSVADADYFYFDSIFNTMSGALKIQTVSDVITSSSKRTLICCVLCSLWTTTRLATCAT